MEIEGFVHTKIVRRRGEIICKGSRMGFASTWAQCSASRRCISSRDTYKTASTVLVNAVNSVEGLIAPQFHSFDDCETVERVGLYCRFNIRLSSALFGGRVND